MKVLGHIADLDPELERLPRPRRTVVYYVGVLVGLIIYGMAVAGATLVYAGTLETER